MAKEILPMSTWRESHRFFMKLNHQAVTDAAYHQHFGGRHFDPYSRQQPVQTIEAQPQYNYDDGGWRWQ